MDVIAILLALGLLMFIAYRGFSVIIFAPLCALFGVLLTLGPSQILPFYSNVFMIRMVDFIKLYFPVFMGGAIFGKLIEMSGAAASISKAIVGLVGAKRATLAIVLACAVLTYGGVSLFVVAFAAYPLASALYKRADIPKRLIPGTIALGSFTFTMDSLPGTPQIQNIIPTTFFKTDIYAAPILGVIGGVFIFIVGMLWLEWRKHKAHSRGEGYGTGHTNESDVDPTKETNLVHPLLAILPLLLVLVLNFILTQVLPKWYQSPYDLMGTANLADKTLPGIIDIAKIKGIWAIEASLLLGILATAAIGFKKIKGHFQSGMVTAVGGSMLATMNTATEYGFGATMANLAGFAAVKSVIGSISSNPLINEAISVNVLAGITGSASGGMSIALAAMGSQYLEQAKAAGIDPQVLHRVASMASGGMDTLPHNGAVITLLAICGLTHRQSYIDILMVTGIKTTAVFVVIAIYLLTGLV